MSSWLSKWKARSSPNNGGAYARSAAAERSGEPPRAFGGEDYIDPTLPAEIDADDEPLPRRVWIKCATVCCTIIGGVLMISGIIFIVGSSAGGATAAEASYAASVQSYLQSTTPTALSSLSVYVNDRSAAFVSVVLSIANSHGTPSATSSSFTVTLPVNTSTSNVTVAASTSRFVAAAPVASQQLVSIGCDSSACAIRDDGTACSNSTSSGSITCNATSLAQVCKLRYGSSSVFVPTSASLSICTFNATCGNCAYAAYLQSLCIVISLSGSSWSQNTAYASCEYPFTSRAYGTIFLSPLPVTIRSDADPYLALQRYSQGSNQFGSTPGTTSGPGVALVVVGCIVLAACSAVVVYLCCTAKEAAEEEEEAEQIRQSRGLRGAQLRAALRAARARARRKPSTELEPRRAALYESEMSQRREEERTGAHEPREL